jgi:hypothetical protein
MGDWSIVSHVLNLGTILRREFSFMPWLLYAWREPPVATAIEAGWLMLRRETLLLLQKL